MLAGLGAAAVLVTAAVFTVDLGAGAKPAAQAGTDPPRSAEERADRGSRPSPSAAAPGASPAAAAVDALGSAQVTAPPTSSKAKPTKTATPTPAGVSSTGTCKVSYYSDGQNTASGERFNPDAMTAANKEWKFGTQVRVTNLANNSSVVVTINDRGPYVSGRCIDLSRGAFQKISSIGAGVITARYEVLQ